MDIKITRPAMPPFDEYCEEIKSLWDTRWLTNNGEKLRKLERLLREFLDVKNISLFTNGHLALESALELLDKEKGEIITTPFTFISTTNAIIRKGFTPVFCDINLNDFTIDTALIENLINERTVAIVPVHVYGNICDYKRIEKIAKKYSLKVIYDAAHAFGEIVNGIPVARLGDISMMSFHSTKVYNTIEGGCLAFNNPLYYEKLEKLKNFGMNSEGEYEYSGGNSKMNEFQAAMGICNLKNIEENIIKRKNITEIYDNEFSGLDGIITNKRREGVKYNYSYYPVLLNDFNISRDELCKKFSENGIQVRKYFYPITNSDSMSSTPKALHVSENIITLPLYAELNDCQIERIVNIIKK